MRINKDIRRMSKALLRASFTDGRLDRGKIASVIQSLVEKKPRHYIDVLENYKRLLRLELEKRHARIESATELPQPVQEKIVSNLKQKYGDDLTYEFVVDPELLGGIRVRVGSDVWDGTVRNRLQRLEQQL
jgi:F-type H+-transporting ATPase subunit delta